MRNGAWPIGEHMANESKFVEEMTLVMNLARAMRQARKPAKTVRMFVEGGRFDGPEPASYQVCFDGKASGAGRPR
jgi:hypothetical protein